MGDVIIVYKILPASPDKFDQVKAGLEKLKPQRLEEEPIGFGLSALKFTAIIPDAGGHQDELEEKIRSIDGVGEIEVLRASRSM
jgi:elongation factor 1-beta